VVFLLFSSFVLLLLLFANKQQDMECEIFLLLLSALLDLELILRKVFTKKHSRKVGESPVLVCCRKL